MSSNDGSNVTERIDAVASPLHVVAAILSDSGRVLACRRRLGKIAGGKWEFPGGKVEPGESVEAALVREIQEELGLAIIVGEELTTDDTIVGERMIRLTCLHARLDGPRPESSIDHDQLVWLLPADLRSLDWAAPDLPAVRLLAN